MQTAPLRRGESHQIADSKLALLVIRRANFRRDICPALRCRETNAKASAHVSAGGEVMMMPWTNGDQLFQRPFSLLHTIKRAIYNGTDVHLRHVPEPPRAGLPFRRKAASRRFLLAAPMSVPSRYFAKQPFPPVLHPEFHLTENTAFTRHAFRATKSPRVLGIFAKGTKGSRNSVKSRLKSGVT
jgi:hypothetical protein